MPGFWYTIESTAPSHLLHQFRGSIVAALDSKRQTRVQMRAWSAKQRFPVKQWLEDLETLQSEAIRLHNKEAAKKRRFAHKALLPIPSPSRDRRAWDSSPAASVDDSASPRPSTSLLTGGASVASSLYQDSPPLSRPSTAAGGGSHARSSSPYRDSPPAPATTDHRARSVSQPPQLHISGPAGDEDEEEEGEGGSLLPPIPFYAGIGSAHLSSDSLSTMIAAGGQRSGYDALSAADAEGRLSVDSRDGYSSGSGSSRPQMPGRDSSDSFAYRMMAPDNPSPAGAGLLPLRLRNTSLLSVNEVVGARTDYALQKVDPFFNDSTGEYYRAFQDKLSGLTAKNSEGELCIEEYLVESERDWSKRFRNAKLGRSKSPLGRRSLDDRRPGHSRGSSYNSIAPSEADSDERIDVDAEDPADDEFLLGKAYKPPTGLKK